MLFDVKQGKSEKWSEKEVLTESQSPSRLGSTLFIVLLRTVAGETRFQIALKNAPKLVGYRGVYI